MDKGLTCQYDDSLMGPYHISVGLHPARGGVCCETLNAGLSRSLGAGPANSRAARENKVFRHGCIFVGDENLIFRVLLFVQRSPKFRQKTEEVRAQIGTNSPCDLSAAWFGQSKIHNAQTSGNPWQILFFV